jgi:hypothetical protein
MNPSPRRHRPSPHASSAGIELLSRFSVTRDFTDRSAIRISEKFKGTAPEAWEAIAGAVLKRKGF